MMSRPMFHIAAGWVTLAAAIGAAMAAPMDMNVDGVHSSVVFRIKHMDAGYIYGRFNDLTGTVKFDPAQPTASQFNLTVKAASVDTANTKRDDHLRSPDFFNARQFPEITFRSTKVESGEAGSLKVTGDLTLHGVTKTIAVDIEHIGTKTSQRGTVSGFESVFTIKRSEFGMTYGIENGGAGDEVKLMVAFECKPR